MEKKNMVDSIDIWISIDCEKLRKYTAVEKEKKKGANEGEEEIVMEENKKRKKEEDEWQSGRNLGNAHSLFFTVDKVDLPVSWPPWRANIFGVIIASFCSERAIVEKQDEKDEDKRVTKREKERGESLRRSFVQLEIELGGIKIQRRRLHIR